MISEDIHTAKEMTSSRCAGSNTCLLYTSQYQYGQNLFTEDGKVTFNNDAIKTVVQRMKDIYEVDGSGDYNFGNNSGDNFGQGMIAMYLGWGFMHGLFQALWPETEFGSFEIPTPTEDVPYAYHRYNG